MKLKKDIIQIFAIIIVFSIIIVIAIYNFNNKSKPEEQSLAPSVENNWTKGNKNASVILVEYSDLQCPACGFYYPMLKKLSEEFKNEILFIYKHFPLRQIHKNAQIAAQATEAAGMQGKFWEMHGMIFDNQKIWSNQNTQEAKQSFILYAKSLNLNLDKFKKDIESEKVINKVNKDYLEGIKLNVNATPTFFLNGNKINNPRSYNEFVKLIEKEISNNK